MVINCITDLVHIVKIKTLSIEILYIIFFILDVLLPYKKRPESTGIVARNLVAGALGIRTNVSREQRQKEKQMLSEARGTFMLKSKT